MSAFKRLKEVSKNFEDDLNRVSNELFSAKAHETFEDKIAKKLRDLSLFTSKSRLLKAKHLSFNPQILEEQRDQSETLTSYEDTVVSHIIEQQVVKSVTQTHAVKTLLTTPDSLLDPEMIEKKEKILAAFSAYQMEESMVQQLQVQLREREDELARVREEWHAELGELRQLKQSANCAEINVNGPIYQKLSELVSKLQLMSWLAARLSGPRARGYDWLHDPQRRLRTIKLTRTHYTISHFVDQYD